ncbi:MAG: lactonase family protein [Proteobacteria bacterium]|nr:lactonase family protein [Verrucomicrobiota bacterium]NBU08332.1 lactonase family protein [Pseudomonadota bacterium]
MNRHRFLKLASTSTLAAALGSSLATAADKTAGPTQFRAYVGTYTGKKSQGIYMFTFNAATGEVGKPELAGEAVNPSFLAFHPNGKSLYAVGEVNDVAGKKGGGVSAFAIQPDGKLKLLSQHSTVGAGPCFVTVDKSGKVALAANYGGGSVVALPIRPDGSVGEHTGFVQHEGKSVTKRQSQPNAHSVNVSPDNRFAFVADLGLDKVLIYKLDPAKGTLTPNDPPFAAVAPGSGPRHFAFHPSGKFAYLINEINLTMTAFSYDAAKGALKEMHTVSTLPAADGPGPKPGWSTAEVVAHPNGKFLYGSNRGHDTIAVFSVADDGKITLVQNAPAEVKTPRNFNLDPTGKWLFTEGQGSDTIALFKVDQATGKLTATDTRLEIGTPVCLKFLAVK